MGQRINLIFLHFYVFQSISSRLRHTFFRKFLWAQSAKRARAKRARCKREYVAPDCDTSHSNLVFLFKDIMKNHKHLDLYDILWVTLLYMLINTNIYIYTFNRWNQKNGKSKMRVPRPNMIRLKGRLSPLLYRNTKAQCIKNIKYIESIIVIFVLCKKLVFDNWYDRIGIFKHEKLMIRRYLA